MYHVVVLYTYISDPLNRLLLKLYKTTILVLQNFQQVQGSEQPI